MANGDFLELVVIFAPAISIMVLWNPIIWLASAILYVISRALKVRWLGAILLTIGAILFHATLAALIISGGQAGPWETPFFGVLGLTAAPATLAVYVICGLFFELVWPALSKRFPLRNEREHEAISND